MTDILKFQDKDNSLYIEPDSRKVKMADNVRGHNFEILKHELDLLHENVSGSKILLVALGSKCDGCLKTIIQWLPEETREWIVVPPTYMAHYSQAGWNSVHSKERVAAFKVWCDEHIVI